MRKLTSILIKVICFIMIISSTTVYAKQSDSNNKILENYKIANKVYWNYIKGIYKTDIYLKQCKTDITDLNEIINKVLHYSFLHEIHCDVDCKKDKNNLFKLQIQTSQPNIYEYYSKKVRTAVSKEEKEYYKANLDFYKREKANNHLYNSKLNKAIDDIVAKANKYTTTREKLEYVNDVLINNCEYDYATCNQSSEGNEEGYTAYGCLVRKRAVCAGYAQAVVIICKKLRIPAMYVSSAEMNHAWNAVYVDNQWLMIDVTWNDTSKKYKKYFLKSEEEFEKLKHKFNNIEKQELEMLKIVALRSFNFIDIMNIRLEMNGLYFLKNDNERNYFKNILAPELGNGDLNLKEEYSIPFL